MLLVILLEPHTIFVSTLSTKVSVCTLLQMGTWKSVLIIKVSTFQGVFYVVPLYILTGRHLLCFTTVHVYTIGEGCTIN